MIQACTPGHLPQCVALAFRRNSAPESNSPYCSKSEESIYKDFVSTLSDPNSLMVGYFVDGALAGVMPCFVNPETHWADCAGPFFQGDWNQDIAKDMFLFAKFTLATAARFNFYFNAENKNCHQLMKALSAERKDNEYILLLNRANYRPQPIKHRIIPYEAQYEPDLLRLHGEAFPEIYLTGRALIASIGQSREVFCALDEAGAFAGYGVLKYYPGAQNQTAEIFAVKEGKRGQGYGWALLNTVADAALHKYSGQTVDLVVDRLNTHARALYEACGFRLSVENEAFCIRR